MCVDAGFNRSLLSHCIRFGTCPDNPGYLNRYLNACEQDAHGSTDSYAREVYEEAVFLLLDTAADETIAPHWRRLCLDHIHRPLRGLRRLRVTKQHQHDFNQVIYMLNTRVAQTFAHTSD
ncbi:MAG: hypothetical protein AAGG55_06880 [Pseudomonadota bacterium]